VNQLMKRSVLQPDLMKMEEPSHPWTTRMPLQLLPFTCHVSSVAKSA